MNFREALQPQSVNKFTLDVCTPSRLLTQSHKFCTQRAEAHLLGAAQRTLLYEGGIMDLGNYGLRDLNSPLSASVVRKNLCAAPKRVVSALCVEILSHHR